MRSLIRIKPKTVPYQRAGIVFATTSEWLEVVAETLTPEQNARLAADERLTIEYCIDGAVDPEQRVWEPIEAETRLLAADQLLVLTEDDWAELKGFRPDGPIVTGDGSGTALEPIDTLALAVTAQKPELDRLFGPHLTAAVADDRVLPELIRQLDAERVLTASFSQAIDDLKAEKTALAAELDLAMEARAEALRQAGTLQTEIDALKATPPARPPRAPRPAKPD